MRRCDHVDTDGCCSGYDNRKPSLVQYNQVMWKWLLVGLGGLVMGCGFGSTAQLCTSQAQCESATRPGGRCEPSGLCSFADPECPGGRRFGDLAGDQSNQCVDPITDPPDAGVLVDAPVPIDARVDAHIDAPIGPPPPDARVCFGNAPFTICLQSAPSAPLTITASQTIDTTSSPLCAAIASEGDYCVLAATTISVEANVRATGSRPLVLVASDSITVIPGAIIDVGSHRGVDPEIGAGADPAACAAGTLPGVDEESGGGGAGGSFAGKGGNGGAGGGSGLDPEGGAAGQSSAAVTAFTELRGGCAGQAGASDDDDAGGPGGHGGGATLLIAGASITMAGRIDAAGQGGGGGGANATAGGGGGGSGGMIVLDAPVITNTGLLLANGGGGGEGSSGNSTGAVGADSVAAGAAAGGRLSSAPGGDGGPGSAIAAAGGGSDGVFSNNDDNRGGGGGGGGGAGLIKAPANVGGTASPTPRP
jgi:hypothetical protein